jgi:phosphatidylglycerol:prolipoprotein diacylglycerol transferase
VKWLKPGDLLWMYMIIYPIGRFFLDFVRLDASELGGINANQTFMAIVAISATIVLIVRHKTSRVKEVDKLDSQK